MRWETAYFGALLEGFDELVGEADGCVGAWYWSVRLRHAPMLGQTDAYAVNTC